MQMKTRLANAGVFFLDIHKVIEHSRATLPPIGDRLTIEEVNQISQQSWFRYKLVGDIAKHGDSVTAKMFSESESRCTVEVLKAKGRTDMFNVSSDGRTIIG